MRSGFICSLGVVLSTMVLGCGGTRQTVAEPDIDPPSPENPVTAAAWLTPARVPLGGEMDLHVRVQIARGHYLHSTGADPAFTPTSIELQSSDALRSAGGWTTPPADPKGHFTGTIDFRRSLRAADSASPGSHQVICTLTYQACNDELCWPPRKLVLKTSFQTVSSKRSSKEPT